MLIFQDGIIGAGETSGEAWLQTKFTIEIESVIAEIYSKPEDMVGTHNLDLIYTRKFAKNGFNIVIFNIYGFHFEFFISSVLQFAAQVIIFLHF